jgi:hypothetical protein
MLMKSYFNRLEKVMADKAELLKEIDSIPEPMLAEIIDFVKFLKAKQIRDKNHTAVASESSLKKDWLLTEEDEAWKNL